MTFALIIFAQTLFATPVVLHGYIDKAECERSATFIDNLNAGHFCIPEHQP